ncbi:ankyrin repeat domain-containing protein [Gimesia aquarii]|uniref:Ankyrin repeats (3 copies) n=1 Tax=Gimesia aquarii TaxID=2527964 RepID=A0A517WPG4_9PLAN|nr:ankyrin repeat domain-containing protein [Gimesia aquarii]QDU07154.1 Ankyrin repeats (3 copies) [Gimesia aquarii]
MTSERMLDRTVTGWEVISIVATVAATFVISVVAFYGRTWFCGWLGFAASILLTLVGLFTGLVAMWRSRCCWLSMIAVISSFFPIVLLSLWCIWPTQRSFLLAVRKGDIVSARFALQTGMDVETLQLWGMGVKIPGHSPLTMAAENGDEDMVRLLLEWGADVNRANGHGDYPLYYAAWSGDLPTAQLLLQEGADPVALSGERSALHIAAMMGQLEVIDLLLDAGVPIDLADKQGITPLVAARISKNSAAIGYLLQKGAQDNSPTNTH